jgi:hypothetical protein
MHKNNNIIVLLLTLIINVTTVIITAQCSRIANLSTTDTNNELIFSSANKLNNNNNQYEINLHQYSCDSKCNLCSINDIKWETTLQSGYELCIATVTNNGKCHNGTDIYAFYGSSTSICNTSTPCIRYSQCDPISYLSTNVAVYRSVKSVTKINSQQGDLFSTSFQIQLEEAVIPSISCAKVTTVYSEIEVSESIANNLCVRNPLPEDRICNKINASDACVLTSPKMMDCAPNWTKMPVIIISEMVTLSPSIISNASIVKSSSIHCSCLVIIIILLGWIY